MPSRTHSTFSLLFQPSAFHLESSARPIYFTNFCSFQWMDCPLTLMKSNGSSFRVWKCVISPFKKKALAEKLHTWHCLVIKWGKKIGGNIFFSSEAAGAVNPHKSIPQVPRQSSLDVQRGTKADTLAKKSIKWSCYGPKQPYGFFSTIQNTRKHQFSKWYTLKPTGRNTLQIVERRRRLKDDYIS